MSFLSVEHRESGSRDNTDMGWNLYVLWQTASRTVRLAWFNPRKQIKLGVVEAFLERW